MKKQKYKMKKLGAIYQNQQKGVISGTIFDIQPYSVHDGPGIRTLIFLKGCPLSCTWCSNPESQHFSPQLLYREEFCKPECGSCKDEDGKIDNAGRVVSGPDVENPYRCPYGAARVSGREISLDMLMEVIRKDRPFFGETGGITLSGGEPFCQPEFVQAVLEECRGTGISTAVESCLHVPFPLIERALPFINFFMFDIKLMNSRKHTAYCGIHNEMIFDNIRRLAATAEVPLLPRLALIPGVNDDDENIHDMAAFLAENELRYINMLPYMRLGVMKYKQLGRTYGLEEVKPPSENDIARVTGIFAEHDVFCL
ncbi:MAG: glycyl-radical enzyme activating protein [bacterium]|nr:glycyl-radical enzyme activating protein [bacterium]